VIRRRSLRTLVAAAGLLGLSTASAPARASDADKGAAQVLFEQGRSLVQDRRFEEACPKFAESLRLDPGIGTMLWLADCYENSGKTASAWAEFKEAASTAALHQDPRATLARRRADDLEPKLAKLLLIPPPDGNVAGMEVRRDGAPIGVAEFGVPVPVNPGVHVISVGAAGKKTWSTSVSMVDKPGTVPVAVPVLEAAPEPTRVEPLPLGDSSPPQNTSPPLETPRRGERVWGTRQTLAVASAGVGLVAIGVGSYFGLQAKSTYDAAQMHGESRSSAFNQATASTVLFCVGGAAIVGGALLYFTAPKSSTGAVAFTPILSPWGAGMSVSKAW
jgi:serine/threonine-protein kinase